MGCDSADGSSLSAASAASKGEVLDEVVQFTGYARRSAMRLLNHPPQEACPHKRRRQATYGPEVQRLLVQLWHRANRICTKRLMPFLPTLIEALERSHHLQLSEACRRQLLTMSPATADRLLKASRERGCKSPSTTRAGSWLKQRIPVRTFEQWNETRPGFVEMDLVAHCGSHNVGSFLYTFTLTHEWSWNTMIKLIFFSEMCDLARLTQFSNQRFLDLSKDFNAFDVLKYADYSIEAYLGVKLFPNMPSATKQKDIKPKVFRFPQQLWSRF